MPLGNLHTLTADEYNVRRRALLEQLEGYGEGPYFDSANPPLVTIGEAKGVRSQRGQRHLVF